MATEWITLQAEKQVLLNALRESEVALEKQWAAYLSIKNKSQEMLNAEMAQGIRARVSPDMLSVKLEKQREEYVVRDEFVGGGTSVDVSNSPNDIQALIATLSELISLHEGKSWDSYNNGTTTENVKNTACPPMSSFFTDAQVARAVARGGVRPSQMTLRQIVNSMAGGVCPRSIKKVAAAGKYQIMHYNIAKYIRKNPNDADKLFSPEMQVKIMNDYFLFGGNEMVGLQELVKDQGDPTSAKNYIASQWASVCDSKGKPKYKQKCNQENSLKIGAVIDKINQAARAKGN